MFTVIGVVIVLATTLIGFLMHGGKVGVLLQFNEFVILFGAAFGSLLAANGLRGFLQTIQASKALIKPDPYTKVAYLELLKMMYQLFNVARKEGLLGLEQHIEHPNRSDIIRKYPTFLANVSAVNFFCDTMKVILTGAVGPHDLSEMMEVDLETSYKEAHAPAHALHIVADAMPAFGIIAAVLGVIITMGKIGGEASAIGQAVAAALVGTFGGVLLGYGVFGPMARAVETRLNSEAHYLNCIRYALFSFARGESPITCAEFARRNIDPAVRPGFHEMELHVKERKAA